MHVSVIDAAERELGRPLPPALRARLLVENGGEVKAVGDVWQLHPVWDASNKRTMRKTANNISTETTAARQWPRFPPGALSIASNGTGDLLVVLPAEDGVNHWHHATGTLSGPIHVEW